MYRKSYIGIILVVVFTFVLGVAAVGAAPGPADTRSMGGPTRLSSGVSPLAPVGSGFTYQGRLTNGGSPANGSYDLQFTLYDALSGGNVAGGPVTILSQTVTGGLFTVQLDFGQNAFQGSARWLEIAVRQAGVGSYIILAPRQALTAAPYALSLMPGATITGTLSTSPVLSVTNTSAATFATALFGTGSGSSGIGVKGNGGYTGLYGTGTSNGVYGTSGSITGVGVYGSVTGTLAYGVRGDGGAYGVVGSGTTAGVSGVSYDPNGYGVQGTVQNGTGNAGVYGLSNAANGAGVIGRADSGSNAFGIYGTSTNGYGVYGSGGSTGVYGTGTSYGVRGVTSNGNGYGVSGVNAGPNGTGVYGSGTGASSTGVYGSGTGASSIGVFGSGNSTGVEGTGNTGVYGAGSATGVSGYSTDTGSCGLCGSSSGSGGSGVHGYGSYYGVFGSGSGTGVYGEATSGYGVHGHSNTGYTAIWGDSTGTDGVGIVGDANTGANAIGVLGRSTSHIGVYGSGYDYGVYGANASSFGIGVYGVGYNGVVGVESDPTGYAGVFHGDVRIFGSCCAAEQGTYRIDNPTDPANKYLNQAAVQSQEMLDVVSGNVLLDDKGEATVTVPAWFEAANRDFRYQFAPIGAPAPNLYVAQEVRNNYFKLAGGKAGTKVSWQVAGVRNDPYAQAHPLVVEQDKPAAEKGTYLYPKGYGQPDSKGVDYEQRQKMEQQSNAPRPTSGTP